MRIHDALIYGHRPTLELASVRCHRRLLLLLLLRSRVHLFNFWSKCMARPDLDALTLRITTLLRFYARDPEKVGRFMRCVLTYTLLGGLGLTLNQ